MNSLTTKDLTWGFRGVLPCKNYKLFLFTKVLPMSIANTPPDRFSLDNNSMHV
jgi:hypothetical protein